MLEARRSCTARKAPSPLRCAMPPQVVRSVLLAMPISLFPPSRGAMRSGTYAMPCVLQPPECTLSCALTLLNAKRSLDRAPGYNTALILYAASDSVALYPRLYGPFTDPVIFKVFMRSKPGLEADSEACLLKTT